MGKTRKKNKSDRACPTGLKSMKELEAEELEQSVADSKSTIRIAGAIEKLQSASVEDRECGSEVVAMFANTKEALEELLRLNVSRIAAPLLLDRSLTVRHSIAGALRNLTVFGGHTVCERLVQEDVLTPLTHLFKKCYQTWTPSVPKEGKIDSITEIFIEATHLLWNLCESSEQAVTIFNNENLLPIFLSTLNVKVYGHKVSLAAGQCLHTVTEDNGDLWSQTPPESCKELLLGLLKLDGNDPNTHHLRTLGAGIYLNMHRCKLIGLPTLETFLVLQTLSQTLDVSLADTLLAFPIEDQEMNGKEKEEEPVHDPKEENAAVKETILTLLNAKQLSLEVLTNVCCDDEGADDWGSLCSSDASDETEMPMEEDNPNPNQANMLSMPCEIQEALTKLNMVQKVEDHIFMPDEIPAKLCTLTKTDDVVKKLETVRCRALLCLHNVVEGMDLGEGLSDGQRLHNLWLRMAKLVFTAAEKGQSELLEASTSSLRAILQRLAEAKVLSCISELTMNDLSALYKVVHDCVDPKVRVNVLRIVATLGYLLGCAYTPQQDPFIANIGQFLIGLGLKDTEAFVNAEAADALMDVFAEDHLDSVARQILLVQNCRQILSSLKAKVGQQRKKQFEHQHTVAIAKTNLARFIKYKSKQSSNGHS